VDFISEQNLAKNLSFLLVLISNSGFYSFLFLFYFCL
jgi:hypothetical protein